MSTTTTKPQLCVIEDGNQLKNKEKLKNNIIFSQDDLEENFEDNDLHTGYKLFKGHCVKSWEIKSTNKRKQTQIICGEVLDSRKSRLYNVEIYISPDDDYLAAEGMVIESVCNCREEFDCVHAAALVLQALSENNKRIEQTSKSSAYEIMQQRSAQFHKQQSSEDRIETWSKYVMSAGHGEKDFQEKADEAIIYLLNIKRKGREIRLEITLESAKKLKHGGYGKSRAFDLYGDKVKSIQRPEDKDILSKLYVVQSSLYMADVNFSILLKDCDSLLEVMLLTDRVYWKTTSKFSLSMGETKKFEPRWDINSFGEQSLNLYAENSNDPADVNLLPGPNHSITLLPINPLWYYDKNKHVLGKVISTIPADALLFLMQAPPIEPSAVVEAQNRFNKLLPNAKTGLPTLHLIKRVSGNQVETPSVVLRLYGKELPSYITPMKLASHMIREIQPRWFDNIEEMFSPSKMALAECQFNYHGRMVTLAEPEDKIEYYKDGLLHSIRRDKKYERQCVEKLDKINLEPVELSDRSLKDDKDLLFSFMIADSVEDEAVVAEQLSTLQSLAEREGWHLSVEDSLPVRIIHEVDEWYAELDEKSEMDWFGMSLGVMVNNEQVNILPLLLDKINNEFNTQSISKLPDNTPCELKMENGQYLKIPFNRIRRILLVLCELFEDKSLDEEGRLKLPRLKASVLPEIEKAVGKTRMRWLGKTKLKEFGERLSTFKGIKKVKAPKEFNAILRPYQQEGLNWLQFLREYGLNGILADDMGLGKTIQTLAHLCIEKKKKHLKLPSLLVAPTSLMTNWANESERFAPSLNILVLHGPKRQIYFDEIKKADLVFSTYPLIMRDKDIFLKHEYQFIILDEAHQIKNSQAKVTQVILQLEAKYRLCLTGTPMENHLGELWSLFNFILPGLLGTKTQFKRLFRFPIEKQGDAGRHEQLIKRIKPFMLRRRKDEVVKDLPEKTEIIRKVELSSEQRDLYESVRLTMEKKVRKAVDAQGLNRSQIIILDALLKLRQICCAPSLLKLSEAKKVKKSSKLENLMSFLPHLIEEGRRVLLFSSFATMLLLIESELKKKGISYAKITGKTVDRKTPIDQFQNKEVPLFLISLKAGGVGLNLTAADTVIHYDPWWNPASEQQATDRAYRIGQKNPVFVYKMIVEGTVEEKILALQSKKQEIIEGVLDSNKQSKLQLTQEDLDALFKPLDE